MALYGQMAPAVLMAVAVLVDSFLLTATDLVPSEGSSKAIQFTTVSGLRATVQPPNKKSKVDRLGRSEVLALHVKTEVSHRVASTLLHQRTANSFTGERNRTTVFDAFIPRAAFVVNFSVAIDGQIYRGEMGERPAVFSMDRERKLHSSLAGTFARSRGFQLFRAELNVRPRAKVDFNLTYQELLQRRLGFYEHVVILRPGQLVSDLKVDVKIRETREILNVTGKIEPINSTSDGVSLRMRRTGKTMVHGTYSPSVSEQTAWSDDGLDAQITVKYDVKRQLDAGEIQIRDGYFIHFFAPTDLNPIERNLIFIVDSSSTMSGSRHGQTSAALCSILDDLQPSDMFNVIFYSSSVRYWNQNEGVVVASRSSIHSAKEFVRSENASTGANMNDALLRGIEFLVKQRELDPLAIRISMIVLLTDGNPTTGVMDYDRILSNVRQANGARVSVFALALGTGARFAFLRKLAQQNRGFARRIDPAADATRETMRFTSEISSPLLENIRVRYNEAVEDTSLSEVDFPAYFSGSEVVVVGRLKGQTGNLAVKVSGGSTQGYMALDAHAKIPRHGRDKLPGLNFAEKAWTHSTIRKLLRKTLEYTNETIMTSSVTTVRHLSLQHSVMSPLVCMNVPKLKELQQPICLADPDEDLPEESSVTSVSVTKKGRQDSKSSGNRLNKHRFFVDNDPHFLVTVDGLKEGVCFDVDGVPGQIYQLIHDKETGLTVNALITGKNITNEFPTVKTYLGKLAVLYGKTSVVVDPEMIILNGALHNWKQNASFNITDDVMVEITYGKYVTVTVKDVTVLRVLRHLVKPIHPYKVNYLGFYIEDPSGLSEHIHGLIGQFTHQVATEKRSSLELVTRHSRVKLQARLTFSGPHMSHRTVSAVLADRRDMDLNRQTPCWHVPHNGAGLIKGSTNDYTVPYLHYRKSSFSKKLRDPGSM